MTRRAAMPPRVLVVDDDSTTRETFQYMLKAEGYSVVAAPTIEAGFLEAGGELPDVLLLDLHMPTKDGLACLRAIRSMPGQAHFPVAIVTGDYFLDEDVARELAQLGASVYFKPLWEDDLRRIVQSLVHKQLPVASTSR